MLAETVHLAKPAPSAARAEPATGVSYATPRKSSRQEQGTGIRALSAEDKARIGNLIKVLAQERKDKEELQQMLCQQTSRMQDMEQERDRSRKKEAALVGRVSRSLNLLKACQSKADVPGQATDVERGAGRLAELETAESGCSQRQSLAEKPLQTMIAQTDPQDPASPRTTPTGPATGPSTGPSTGPCRACNALQDAEPRHFSDIELTTRQPANALVFSLKPPQLSLLQRYLSIQEESSAGLPCTASGPLPKRQWTPERLRHTATPVADVAVQTPSDVPSTSSRFTSPPPRGRLERPRVSGKGSPQLSPRRPSPVSPSRLEPLDPQAPRQQRLRLGKSLPRRWRHAERCRGNEASSTGDLRVSSALLLQDPLQASPTTTWAELHSRTQETEPLFGSPLVPRQAADQGQCYQDSIGGLSWAPLRLDSYYAPNMFDVIDSLESGPSAWGADKAKSQPAAIAEELRRLQRELIMIEQRVQRGSKVGPPTKQAGEACEASSPWLKVASPKSGPGDEELSREIDDVLLLLRDRISEKSEKTVQVLP